MANATYAVANTGNQYIQGGLEITSSTSGGVVTVTAKLYMRRTNTYGSATASSSVAKTITIDGTATSATSSVTVNGGQQNVWQGPILTASKTFTGAGKNITVSWSTRDNVSSNFTGSSSATFSVPSGYVAPSGLAVSVASKTYNSVSLKLSLSSYGVPSGENNRYISGIIYSKDEDAYGGKPHRETKLYRSTSGTVVVDNNSENVNGTVTIAGNTTYSYGAYAGNTAAEQRVYHKAGVTTPCPPMSSLGISGSQSYVTASTVKFNMAWSRPADGNALARTLYYRVSTDNGANYGGWTSLGAVANSTTSGTFTLSGLATGKSVRVQAKMTTSAGDSNIITSGTITTLTTHTAPNFSNFTYADTKSAVTTLTGSNQILIQGQSTPRVTISSANKATGNQSIAVSSYSISFSGSSYSVAYSTSDINKDLSAPTQNGTLALKVSAVDALSLSKAVTKNVTVIPWSAPVINASLERTSGFESETTVRIRGTYAQILVSNTVKNTIRVEYRYKKSSETTWGAWTERPNTVSGSNWSTNDLVMSFDNNYQWDVEVRATDKFTTTTAKLTLAVGMPKFFIGTDGRVSIGGKPSKALDSGTTGHLEVNGNVYSGGEDISRKIRNYYNSRPTTADTTATGKGGLFTFKATSAMTTSKPKSDAHIMQLEWDNASGYDAQIATGNNKDQQWIACRAQTAGSWGSWTYMLKDVAGAVGNSHLASNSVTTAKITDANVTTAKIADKNVTTAKLADKAVTPAKIDFTTKPVWSTFIYKYTTDASGGSTTTLRGTSLGLEAGNGGTMMRIISGAGGIRAFKQHIMARFTTNITSDIGIHNIKAGSTTWCYWTGVSNGSYTNKSESHASDSGQVFGTALVTNGSRSALSIEIIGSRVKENDNTWHLHGHIMALGSATSFFFNIECAAKDANSIPTLYQRGANSGNTAYLRNVYEVLEE